MKIRINIVFVKTHHSINMIERYYESFRCIYVIIVAKIVEIDFNAILRISFKAFNNLTDLDDLIFILLVFKAYFRMIEMNVFSSTIIQRSIVMRKTMNEIRKLIATRQLNDALNIQNDSFSTLIHDISLNLDVLVYREKNDNQSKSWKDSFKFLNINDESAIIELSSDSTKFRSTMIKSYYDDDHLENSSFLSRSIFRSLHLFRNHRMCLNRMINSQFRTIRNQLKFFRTHQDVIAIDFKNISHRLHFWVLYSMRLSISSSLRLRYSLSLSFLNSIRSYALHFLNSSHSDKKRSRNSSKKMFFN
jgi:hypothetical protein